MHTFLSPAPDDPVYPGQYTPQPEKEANTIKHMERLEYPDMPVLINLDQFDDHYELQVALPGIQSEDIFVYTDNRLLSILIAANDCREKPCTVSSLHEFETGNRKRQLQLPGDADTAFVSAEYCEGILHLYFPRNPKAATEEHRQIIVY